MDDSKYSPYRGTDPLLDDSQLLEYYQVNHLSLQDSSHSHSVAPSAKSLFAFYISIEFLYTLIMSTISAPPWRPDSHHGRAFFDTWRVARLAHIFSFGVAIVTLFFDLLPSDAVRHTTKKWATFGIAMAGVIFSIAAQAVYCL